MALRPAARGAFILLLFFAIEISSSIARAGFWLEPYAGYFNEHLEVGISNDGQLTYKSDGWLTGVRVGWAYRVYYFGIDGAVSHGDNRLQNDSSATFNSQSSHMRASTIGVLFGARYGEFRAFGGYNFQSELVLQTNPIEPTFKGSGFRIGASWDVSDPISVNIEGLWTKYNKLTDVFGEQAIGGGSARSSVQGVDFIISISIPWDADPARPIVEPGQPFWKRKPRQVQPD